ncbi:MAG TPA: hypothetical protein VD994_10495, partial [Prosthecobacter sp.]|nr:hypothetical protein [Prosthecobacter sp.]
NANNTTIAVAVQADGKILVGGTFGQINGIGKSLIARLNSSDGTLDTGFTAGTNNYVRSITVQADGEILIGGDFGTVNSTTRQHMARLNSDGTLDAFNPNINNDVYCTALQSDGKVLVAGIFGTVGGTSRPFVARLDNDAATETISSDATSIEWLRGGALPETTNVKFDLSTDGGATWTLLGDATRISGGWELTGLTLPYMGQIRARARTGNGYAAGAGIVQSQAYLEQPGDLDQDYAPNVYYGVYGIALEPTGNSLVTGDVFTVDGVSTSIVARIGDDDSLVNSFGSSTPPGTEYCLVAEPAGTVLVGRRGLGGRLLRYQSNGTWDTSFAPSITGAGPHALALQPDGKILAVGYSSAGAVARLNSDGSTDTAFYIDSNGEAYTLALQSDGKIVIGGQFTTVDYTTRNYIARVNSDGTLDNTFNPGASNEVYALAIQSDGKILVGGSFGTIAGNSQLYLARLNANGSFDSSFTPSTGGSVHNILLQADGKIIVAAAGSLLRLNSSDGSVDTTFDANLTDGYVYGCALQKNGRLLAGGIDITVNGDLRDALARFLNNPATESLSVTSSSRVEWLRGGSSPEAQHVSFELSTNGGSSWTTLGNGTRISGGWELTGLSLPGSGHIRARARTPSGQYNGSSGLVETVKAY